MKHLSRSSCVCLRATPWLVIICVLLLAAGLPLWFISSNAATTSTKVVLASASIDAPIIATFEGVVATVRTVVLVLVVAALLLVVLLAALGTANTLRRLRHGSPGAGGLRSYLAVGATAGTSLWLAMLAVVLLLAVSTTWLLGAWAGSALLDEATRFSSSAEAAAQQAVKSGNQLVASVRDMQLLALETAPQEVKATQWYSDFRNGVQQMNSTTLLQAVGGTSSAASTPCGAGCVSLDFLADLAGLSNNCICISNTINGLQGGLLATRQHMLPALVGLLLLYLAASWLLIHCAASYAHAKRDLRERRLVASLAAPTRPSFASGSTVPVDAAIDITGTPSAVSLKGLQAARAGSSSDTSGYTRRDQQAAGAQAAHPSAPLMPGGFDTSHHSSLFGGERPVQHGSEAAGGRVVCVGDRDQRLSVPGNAPGLL